MDGNRKKRSVLESSYNTSSGYSIEYNNTTYQHTLDERIQAAKTASSTSKQAQKQNNKEKLHFTNNRTIVLEEDTHVKNKTGQSKIDFNFKLNMPSTITKSICTPVQTKYNTHDLLPAYKGGGLMQRRLESIKANKKLPTIKCDNITESANFSNNRSNLHETLTNNHVSDQFNINDSKRNEFKSRAFVYKNVCSEIGYYDRTKSIANTSKKSESSIQNRLIRAKEEMKAKSQFANQNVSKIDMNKNILGSVNLYGHTKAKEEMKAKSQFANQKNVSKIDMNKNPSTYALSSTNQDKLTRAKEEMKTKSKFNIQNSVSKIDSNKEPFTHTSGNIHQDTNISVHNIKNKTKRLNQSNESTKNKVSTAKKIILHKSDVNQMISKELITVQQKPIVSNTTNHTISHNTLGIIPQTVVSTKLENSNRSKSSSQKVLDCFSFVLPQPNSAQSRLEQIKKIHINNDEFMEWEEDIIKSNQIVESVKDLRKTINNYEPMEWTPDSIIYSDQINHCLVIDTNIFLSNLRSITAIIDKYLPEYGYITLVIPWQVLQELDFIKNNDNTLGFRAREATRWLLDMLNKNHPRLKGQPMIRKDNGVYADDSILDCALTLKNRVNSIDLITDDKMLSVKSQINGIQVRNSAWLNNLTSNFKTGSQIFQEAVSKYPIVENELIMKFEPHLEHFIAKVLRFSVSQSMDSLNFSKKVWWRKYSLKPLNITNCLSKLKEHWNTIAPHQLQKSPKKQIDWLIYFFGDFQPALNDNVLNWNELYNLLKNCTKIINALPYEYYHITDILLNDLLRARKFLKQNLDCITPDDDEELSLTFSSNLTISNDSALCIDNILLNILKKVNTFCTYVYKAHGCSLNLSENDSNCVLSKIMDSNKNIKNITEDYCHKLSNIIKVMLKIKIMTSEQILKSHIIINAFLKAIVEFDNGLTKLNRESLLDYVLMKDKNMFLNILISFQNNLASVKNLVTIIKFN